MRKKLFSQTILRYTHTNRHTHNMLFSAFFLEVYTPNDVDMCLVDKKYGNYNARMNKEKNINILLGYFMYV